MPFAFPAKKATYIDPTVSVVNGNSVVIGFQNFIGPYASLNGVGGAIKIGNTSSVLDNATIMANPGRRQRHPEVLIGDQVVIGFGAHVEGPSVIGDFGAASKPTSIGAMALVDDATIEPGAIVSPLARVGPGVTVPSGFRVLPGANVTTDAEASKPSLGMVVPVTTTDISTIKSTISDNEVAGRRLHHALPGQFGHGSKPRRESDHHWHIQWQSRRRLGRNLQPGPTSASFEPAKTGPEFPSPRLGLVGVQLSNFPARITGQVIINMPALQAAQHMGRANALRADQGQPITIASIAKTGRHVSINSPLGGTLSIGTSFRTGSNVVVLSGTKVNMVLGDNVTINSGAVVVQTSIGSDSTVGEGAYLDNSNFPAHTIIPPKAIYVNSKFMGYVAW